MRGDRQLHYGRDQALDVKNNDSPGEAGVKTSVSPCLGLKASERSNSYLESSADQSDGAGLKGGESHSLKSKSVSLLTNTELVKQENSQENVFSLIKNLLLRK